MCIRVTIRFHNERNVNIHIKVRIDVTAIFLDRCDPPTRVNLNPNAAANVYQRVLVLALMMLPMMTVLMM